jgi:aminobenzoyl-glutamate utilization protein B
MLYAAEIMARTAIAITCMENPLIIEEAKQELQNRLKDEENFSLIPVNYNRKRGEKAAIQNGMAAFH